MVDQVNLPLILLAALISTASPGPATLAIASASMSSGRRNGLAMAAGITTGSWLWSVSAAMGLGAIMLAHAWAFEVVRYLGACYLLYLAFRSARSAFAGPSRVDLSGNVQTLRSAYFHGLGLHMTNPKAILFFGALFSIGMPASASGSTLALVIVAVGLQSCFIFHFYAVLFSNSSMSKRYARLQKWFDYVFAAAFGLAGIKVLTTRIS